MNVKFYRPHVDYSPPTWLVVIDNSVYEMSENARMPNGVNTYLGELHELAPIREPTHYVVDGYESVPNQIAAAAVQRAYDMTLDVREI